VVKGYSTRNLKTYLEQLVKQQPVIEAIYQFKQKLGRVLMKKTMTANIFKNANGTQAKSF
jgi:hypothetical protein